MTRVKNVALLKKQPAEIDNRVGRRLLSPHALALWESRKAHRRRRLVQFREAHTHTAGLLFLRKHNCCQTGCMTTSLSLSLVPIYIYLYIHREYMLDNRTKKPRQATMLGRVGVLAVCSFPHAGRTWMYLCARCKAAG